MSEPFRPGRGIERGGQGRAGERGVSIVEVLLAAALMLVLTYISTALVLDTRVTANTEEELIYAQDTARNLLSLIEQDLLLAGLGCKFGATAIEPIIANQPTVLDTFSTNAITVHVNRAPIATALRANMPQPSSEVKVRSVDGMFEGDRLVIFDKTGSFDWFTLTHVQTAALMLQHRPPDNPKFSKAYNVSDDTVIAKIQQIVYNYDPATRVVTRQLRAQSPDVADHVVEFDLTYYDDSQPPQVFQPASRAQRDRITRVDVSVGVEAAPVFAGGQSRVVTLQTSIMPRNRSLQGALSLPKLGDASP